MAFKIPLINSGANINYDIEDEQFFFEQIEEITPQELEQINKLLPEVEEIMAVFNTDIDLEGKYNQQWIVLGSDYLYNLDNIFQENAKIHQVKLSEIKEIEVRLLEGNQIIVVKTADRGLEVLRCSRRLETDFTSFIEFLDDYLKEINNVDESFLDKDIAFSRGKSRVKRCPECGKPISYRKSVCNDCLDKRKLLVRLLKYIKPHFIFVVMGFVLMGLATFIGQLPPLLSRSLIDDVLIPAGGAGEAIYENGGWLSEFFLSFASRGTVRLLGVIVITMLVINVLRSILNTLRSYIVQWLGQRVVVDLRSKVYEHLQSLSLSFFNKESTGRLMARVTHDVGRLESFLSRDLLRLGEDVFTLVIIIAILFSLSVRLTLIVIIPAPFLVFLTFYFRNKLRRVYMILWRRNAGLSGILADTIPGIRVVKAFSQEKREINRFNKKNKELYEGNMESIKLRTAYSPSMQFLTFLGTILIWWFGGQQVIDQTLTTGTLMAFTGYMWSFYRPVQDLCRMNHRFQRTATSADRVFEILDTEPELADEKDALAIDKIDGRVEFKNVTFSYDKGTPALKNVSFVVKPGEIIGLAGRSGAGKSTLINLICRFYDPDNGQVLIDGYDLRDIEMDSLRKQIGIVLQDPFLFSGTIADNIRYGKPDATRHEVIAAAKAANAHNFIYEFSDGYETEVGERGVRISSGQRQRISIARALLKDPRILILDEATSSVDTQTEAEIQEALDRLVEGRTTFAIAHRLSTLRNADRLFILEDGKIVEEGSHDELLKEEGVYEKMYNMQREMKAI